MREHHIKKYMTEIKAANGAKVGVYVMSCVPCNIYRQEYATKSARDKAAAEHTKS